MKRIHNSSVYFSALFLVLAALIIGLGSTAEANQDIGNNDDRSQMVDRELVSGYVVGGVNFMESGMYEQYLEQFIYADDPPRPEEKQNHDDDWPTIYLKIMGLDETECYMGEDPVVYSHNRAFCSDLFYMEYPKDWGVGADGKCPFVFYHNSETLQSGLAAQDWQEFYDDALSGSMETVIKYIEDGGLDEQLMKVIGEPVSDEYELETDASAEDAVIFLSLKKGSKLKASIVVWTNIGKFTVRNEDVGYHGYRKDDYGRIMVYQEWDEVDFSTRDSIMAYMTSGRLSSMNSALNSVVLSDYQTEYHDFIRLDADFGDRLASIYIPITPSYNKNWMIVFEAYKDSKMNENAYNIQERIIKTFIALPFKHRVEKGDDLSAIANQYTGNPDNYVKIADYKTNSIKNNLINPGDMIEIPLGLLFEKINYQ